jgi:hypothetical protein
MDSMQLKIYRIRTYVFLCLLAIAMVSCKKNQDVALLPGAASIKEAVNTDTLSNTVSTDKDSLITIELEAVLKEAAGSGPHTVVLEVDTSEIVAYREKYGNMPVLPTSNYFIPFTSCNIAAGATVSSAAEINIISESKLKAQTTYVLPVVIKNVDGQAPQTIGQGQVIYLLIKTTGIDYGNPIDKASWSIISYSSAAGFPTLSIYAPANVLDNNSGSIWATASNGTMPQYLTIDMGQSYNLRTVTYQDWPDYTLGGNPTQIMIELSTDLSTWSNMGQFADTVPSFAVKNLPINPVTPARYIRFTINQASLLGGYTQVALSEIGANN